MVDFCRPGHIYTHYTQLARYTHAYTYCPPYHCRVGLALDAYMMPVEDGINDSVEQPLLFINTWTWQWPKNVAKIISLLDTSCTKVESKMMTATIKLRVSDIVHFQTTPFAN